MTFVTKINQKPRLCLKSLTIAQPLIGTEKAKAHMLERRVPDANPPKHDGHSMRFAQMFPRYRDERAVRPSPSQDHSACHSRTAISSGLTNRTATTYGTVIMAMSIKA